MSRRKYLIDYFIMVVVTYKTMFFEKEIPRLTTHTFTWPAPSGTDKDVFKKPIWTETITITKGNESYQTNK